MKYREVIRSQTAKRKGLSNTPTDKQLARIKTIAIEVFEPLRKYMRHAIYISSCFRSSALNKAIGGAKGSQHMANNGAAMDLDGQIFGSANNCEIGDYIRENLDFDQLIYEGWDEDYHDYAWVHVSYVSPEKNRNQVLIMSRDEKGNVKYQAFKDLNVWSSR